MATQEEKTATQEKIINARRDVIIPFMVRKMSLYYGTPAKGEIESTIERMQEKFDNLSEDDQKAPNLGKNVILITKKLVREHISAIYKELDLLQFFGRAVYNTEGKELKKVGQTEATIHYPFIMAFKWKEEIVDKFKETGVEIYDFSESDPEFLKADKSINNEADLGFSTLEELEKTKPVPNKENKENFERIMKEYLDKKTANSKLKVFSFTDKLAEAFYYLNYFALTYKNAGILPVINIRRYLRCCDFIIRKIFNKKNVRPIKPDIQIVGTDPVSGEVTGSVYCKYATKYVKKSSVVNHIPTDDYAVIEAVKTGAIKAVKPGAEANTECKFEKGGKYTRAYIAEKDCKNGTIITETFKEPGLSLKYCNVSDQDQTYDGRWMELGLGSAVTNLKAKNALKDRLTWSKDASKCIFNPVTKNPNGGEKAGGTIRYPILYFAVKNGNDTHSVRVYKDDDPSTGRTKLLKERLKIENFSYDEVIPYKRLTSSISSLIQVNLEWGTMLGKLTS